MDAPRFLPDHWLLCGERLHRAVVERARDEAGAEAEDPAAPTLLQLRLASGLIELLAPARLAQRVGVLLAEAPRTVHIVVEALSEAVLPWLLALPPCPAATQLRLHVWRESPLDAIDAMRAPDAALLDAWRALLAGSVGPRWLPHASLGPAWLARCRAALQGWRVQAQEDHGERFDALYPQRPFAWQEFEFESGDDTARRYVHRDLALLALTLEPGRPAVPQGLLGQAPASLLRVLSVASVPANAQHYVRSQQAAGVRRGPPGTTLTWHTRVDGQAFDVVMQLPVKVGRELSLRLSLAQPLAAQVDLVDLQFAGEPVLRMPDPLRWTCDGGSCHTLSFLTFTTELQRALNRVEAPQLTVSLLQTVGERTVR